MQHRFVNFAAGVSLLLFTATVILLVRSYWISDAITYGSASGKYGVQSAAGSMFIVAVQMPLPVGSSEHGLSGVDDNAVESFVNWSGLDYWRHAVPSSSPRTQSLPDIVYPLASASFSVPLWALAGAFLIVPVASWVVAKRNRWLT